jgi:hypothetical protein
MVETGQRWSPCAHAKHAWCTHGARMVHAWCAWLQALACIEHPRPPARHADAGRHEPASQARPVSARAKWHACYFSLSMHPPATHRSGERERERRLSSLLSSRSSCRCGGHEAAVATMHGADHLAPLLDRATSHAGRMKHPGVHAAGRQRVSRRDMLTRAGGRSSPRRSPSLSSLRAGDRDLYLSPIVEALEWREKVQGGRSAAV